MLKGYFDLQLVLSFQEATAVEFIGTFVAILACESGANIYKDSQAGKCLVLPFTDAFELRDRPDVKRPSVEWIQKRVEF